MCQLTSEIKKQQQVINKKMKELFEIYKAGSNPCSEAGKELIQELKKQSIIMNRRLKELLEVRENDRCWSGGEEQCGCWDCEHPDPTPTSPVFAYGFAYTPAELSESGVVRFRIAGPLEEVELTADGFMIAKAGVYQIQYSVVVHSAEEAATPARFQLVINNTVNIASSVTESVTSQQLSSNQLFSLLEGDVVKLVAEVPEGISYSMIKLQVLQVG